MSNSLRSSKYLPELKSHPRMVGLQGPESPCSRSHGTPAHILASEVRFRPLENLVYDGGYFVCFLDLSPMLGCVCEHAPKLVSVAFLCTKPRN